MNLYILSTFVIGPLVVAYFLFKKQEKIDAQSAAFSTRWPHRLRR